MQIATTTGVLVYLLKQCLARRLLRGLLGNSQATDLAFQDNMMFSHRYHGQC